MRDVLFLSTAKANSVGADLRPRAIAREKESGTFIDISEQFPVLFQRVPKTLGDKDRTDRKVPIDQDRTWLAIIDIVGGLTGGGQQGETFTRQEVRDEFDRQHPTNEALHGVGSEHAGKHSRTDFSLAWYISQLKGFGAIDDGKSGCFSIIDLAMARRRFDSADATDLQTGIVNDSGSIEVANALVAAE